MDSRFHVNRKQEWRLLDELLLPMARKRLLFLQAQAGFGKTLLLEQYLDALEQRGYRFATIDLVVGGIGIVDMLAQFCHDWGWERFPRFQESLHSLSRPTTVDVHGVWQIGKAQLQVNLSEDPAQRKAQAQQLTSAWFDDLHHWPTDPQPVVIVIDTYNLKATPERPATVDPELQSWLEGVFLAQVQRTPNLRLILAGQQTPTVNMSWERSCYRHELAPIDDPDAWMEFVAHVGGTINRDMVKGYCITERGHPYSIATRLSMLCISWSSSA